MTENDTIQCGVDGCTEQSRFLLTCGERCPKHAYKAQPETVEYLAWANGCLANNDGAKNE